MAAFLFPALNSLNATHCSAFDSLICIMLLSLIVRSKLMERNLAPTIYVRKQKPKKSVVFDTYWEFAVKRQDAFYARLSGAAAPWSDDPIIQTYKFTNAYRASDRVSQYLIKNVIYSDNWSTTDTFLRILLFKLFNKIETWELLESQFGEVSLKTFDVENYSAVLDNAMAAGGRIYSAAYIMPSGSRKKYGHIKKHRFHLLLINNLIKDGFPQEVSTVQSMQEGYELLLGIESVGKFLAYQFITDFNYSEIIDFQESDFVVPGPGALDGIKKSFVSLGEYAPEDVIRMMFDEQEEQFERLGLEFRSLWGRPLQLIDCQNLFCEVDKYSRVAHPEVAGISGRTRIKQTFKPRIKDLQVWYPPKWGINDKINYDSTPREGVLAL